MKTKLEKLRQEIDNIDRQILELLAKRISVVTSIGKLKKQFNKQPFDKKRWQEVIESKLSLGKNLKLPQEFIKKIYKLIHEHSLKIENDIK